MQAGKEGTVFLEDVAHLLGVGDLEVKSALYLTLEAGVRVTAGLETDNVENVLLYAEIGHVSPGKDEFLRDMAQANFLGAGTEDAILALRPDEPIACLFKRVPINNHSPQDFLPILDTFCQVATNWHLRLKTQT